MSRRPVDYVGRRFGLVTVIKREGRRLLCRCECGADRYLAAANLITHPPKTHQSCKSEFQYELALDST